MNENTGHPERWLMIVDHVNPVSPTGESLQIADALREADQQVQIVALNSQSQPDSSIMSVRRPASGRPDLNVARQIKSIVRRFKPTQVLCWGDDSIKTGPLAMLGCKAKLTAIHTSVETLLRRHFGWSERIALSRFDKHLIRNDGLLEESRCRFPAWDIDTLPFSRSQASPDSAVNDLRVELGLPRSAKLVGTAALLSPRNRIKDFIWAGDLMKCIRDDVFWLVIGEGSHQWRLQRFAKHLQIDGNLRFLDWNTQAHQFISSLDVYVQPSASDDSCCGVTHALSEGIPVVATSDPLHRQFVDHGSNGFVVERGARNEIARCVNRLINEPEIAALFSENGKRKAARVLQSNRQVAMTLIRKNSIQQNRMAQTKRLAS